MAVFEDVVKTSVEVDGKQAINELGRLEMEARDIRAGMDKLTRGTREYVKQNAKLKEVESRMGSLRKEIGVTGMTTRQLTAQQRELNMAISNVTKGTAEYEVVKKKLQEVGSELRARKADINDTRTSWQKFKDSFREFGVFAAATVAGDVITTLAQNFGAFVVGVLDNAAKLSDQFADIQKTTGLTAQEVEALNQNLSKIDTRTSSADLREIAKVAGQIGIAKDDILGFVEATDQIVVALGDEFTGGAEQAAKELGTLKQLFQETKDMKAGEAMSRIGSALNALGSAGTATAPVVAEFTARIGQLGPNLAPSIEQTFGLGAAFQELGLSAEISSGGIANILLTAGKETAAFAQQMGITEQQFKGLLNSDPNEMLLRLAESFKGLDNDQVAKALDRMKIGSQEATKVMGLLANQTDLVREKQRLAAEEFEKNTSIVDEFNIKNQNFAAEYDKAKKKIDGFVASIGNMLLPALTQGIKLILMTIDGLRELPKFVRENQQWFYALGVALLTFNAQAIMASANALRLAAAERIKTIATKSATIAQRALNLALYSNPIGIVIAAVAALAAAFYTAWNESQIFRMKVMGLWEAFKEGVKIVFELYKAFYTFDFKALGDLFTNAGDRIASAFGKGMKDRLTEEMKAANKVVADPKNNPLLGGGGTAKLPRDMGTPLTKEEKEARDKAIAEENKKRQAALEEEEKKKGKGKSEADKLKQQREERLKAEQEAAKAIQKMRIDLMQQGFDKEFALLRFNADQQLAELKGSEEQKAIQQLLIEEQLQRDTEALIQKYDDERVLSEQEQAELLAQIRQGEIDDLLQREQAYYDLSRLSANNALLQKQAELWENEQLTVEEREAALAALEFEFNQAELDAERNFLLAKLELDKEYGNLTEAQRKEIQNRLLGIQIASNQAQLTEEQRLAKERDRITQARLKTASDVANGLQSINQMINGTAAENNRFAKALAIGQIAIDTAKAISAGVASAMTVPFPGNLAAIATTVGTVFANVNRAKEILATAPEPAPPAQQFAASGGYKDGGFTDRAASDSKPVGLAHANEYYMPAWMLRTPQGAAMANIAEAMRLQGPAAVRNMNSPTPSGQENSLMSALIGEVQALRSEVATMKRELKVIFVHEDYKEFEGKKADIEALSGI